MPRNDQDIGIVDHRRYWEKFVGLLYTVYMRIGVALFTRVVRQQAEVSYVSEFKCCVTCTGVLEDGIVQFTNDDLGSFHIRSGLMQILAESLQKARMLESLSNSLLHL